MAKLDDQQLHEALSELDGWAGDESKLTKTFEFEGFAAAIAWMVQVSLAAEKADHHPTWTNSYSRVEVELSSHDAGGVTERDVSLARVMDAAAARR